MFNIRYTELAEADLAELFDLIYSDKPTVAVEFLHKLEIFISLLEANPMMGVECKKKNVHKECRVLIYENYLIFYTITDNEVIILRILNEHYRYEKEI